MTTKIKAEVHEPRAYLTTEHLYDLYGKRDRIIIDPKNCIEVSAIHAALWRFAELAELPEKYEIMGDRFGGCLLILAAEAGRAVCEVIDWERWEDGVFSYEHLETGNPDFPHDIATTLPAHLLRATTRDALYQMADNWQAPDPERMAVIVADWADAADLPLTAEAQALANSLQAKGQEKAFAFLEALAERVPKAVIVEHGGDRCSLALPPYDMAKPAQGPVLTFLYPPAGLDGLDKTCAPMLDEALSLFKSMASDVEEVQVFLSPRLTEASFSTQTGWLEWGCQYRRKTGSRGWVALIQRDENFPIERHS